MNENVADNLSFFAVQVELWRIGTSEPAPRFHVVAQPNGWTRQIRAAEKAGASNVNTVWAETYDRFWVGVIARSEGVEDAPVPAKRRPGRYYQIFSSPHSGSWLAGVASLRDRAISAEAVFRSSEAIGYFDALERDEEAVRAAIGLEARWDRKEDRRMQKIVVPLSGDPNDESDWTRQHEAIVDALARLRRTLER
jgi:hypothetical protein